MATVRGGHIRSTGRGGASRSREGARGGSRSRSRGISTREYGLPIRPQRARAWNYAYSRGAGADRGRRPSYPIDPRHVRAALAYAGRRNTAGSARTVRAAIAHRYGSVAAGMRAYHRATGR
ncbi:MAG TPA: hypothetical protein VLL25_14815 [Acidimicrobiales bacterium]|nr:hypothetical protein [Acidimicrobiales bacterium]